MYEERCEGILLRAQDAGESDLFLTFLTDRYGRIVLRAPGAKRSKKRFGGLLQTFAYHELAMRQTRSRFPVLLRVEPKSMHLPLRDHLEAFAFASYAAELALALAEEGHPNPGLFELMRTMLDFCEEHAPTPKVFARFILRLLQEVGVQPNWQRCMECGAVLEGLGRVTFDLTQGGLLCRDCPPQHHGVRKFHEETRVMLASLQHRRQITALSNAGWAEALMLLELRLLHLLGQHPKSREFLSQMVDWLGAPPMQTTRETSA